MARQLFDKVNQPFFNNFYRNKRSRAHGSASNISDGLQTPKKSLVFSMFYQSLLWYPDSSHKNHIEVNLADESVDFIVRTSPENSHLGLSFSDLPARSTSDHNCFSSSGYSTMLVSVVKFFLIVTSQPKHWVFKVYISCVARCELCVMENERCIAEIVFVVENILWIVPKCIVCWQSEGKMFFQP